MRLFAIAVALTGLASASAVALSMRGEPLAEGGTITLEEETALPERLTPLPVPERVRPVAPDVTNFGPLEQAALERIETREPLSPLGRAMVPSEGPPKETVLHRPIATGAGSFEARGYKVTLAGIEIVAPEEKCGEASTTWICGVHARTAFRNWLRGRALSCVVPPIPPAEIVVTDCTVGGHDPAEWLVTHGWARALPDGPYAALQEVAQAEGRGLFGRPPAVSQPSAITLPAPSSGG